MGMPISLHLRGEDLTSAQVEACVAEVFDSLRDADTIFSTYRADSQISRWERGELALSDADPALLEVLDMCEEARLKTEGYFDARSLPAPLGDTKIFDPSGLVKGWAVQRAAQHLARLTGHGWCLNAGGDVLMHTPAGHPPWRVGIEDPLDRSRIVRVLEVTSGAVATSGTARRGTHIVNPRTGTPVTAAGSVTVSGPSLIWADVYATAAVARGPGAGQWLRHLDGYQAYLHG